MEAQQHVNRPTSTEVYLKMLQRSMDRGDAITPEWKAKILAFAQHVGATDPVVAGKNPTSLQIEADMQARYEAEVEPLNNAVRHRIRQAALRSALGRKR